MTDMNDIMAQVNEEVGKLSTDDLKQELLKYRTRQKVQQKKNQGSDTQKKYQQKQREKQKALKAKAIELGIWDAINKEADAAADKKLEEEADEQIGGDEEEEEVAPR